MYLSRRWKLPVIRDINSDFKAGQFTMYSATMSELEAGAYSRGPTVILYNFKSVDQLTIESCIPGTHCTPWIFAALISRIKRFSRIFDQLDLLFVISFVVKTNLIVLKLRNQEIQEILDLFFCFLQ